MENFGVFRCGSLTQSGRLAIAPLDAKNLEPAKASCPACIRIRVGLPNNGETAISAFPILHDTIRKNSAEDQLPLR